MAFAIIIEIPGGTLDQYDRMSEAMHFKGDGPTSRGSPVTLSSWSTSGSRERPTRAISPR